MSWLLIALAGFLLFMFLIDTVQVLLRIVSAVVAAPVLGAHLGAIFMLANRAATALALLTIGYLVDKGVPADGLMLCYALAALVIMVAHLPLLRRVYLERLILRAFRVLYGQGVATGSFQGASTSGSSRASTRIDAVVGAVTTIGFLGLLAPSLLASTFPEYRATLLQTGFILNSVATIMNVMLVERNIAMTIHGGDGAQLDDLYRSYGGSRAAGYLASGLLFLATLVAFRYWRAGAP